MRKDNRDSNAEDTPEDPGNVAARSSRGTSPAAAGQAAGESATVAPPGSDLPPEARVSDSLPAAPAGAAPPAPPRPSVLRPAADLDTIRDAQREAERVVAELLEEDVDYGVIPGTGDKPTLLKPGAERLCQAYDLAPTYEIVDADVDHDRAIDWVKRRRRWGGGAYEQQGSSTGIYRYVVRCRLVPRSAPSYIVAEGIGSASTLESRYIDRPRDSENTVLKMAQKRALVAATLNALGLSSRFTQDIEDLDLAQTTSRAPDEGGSGGEGGEPPEPPEGLVEALSRQFAEAQDQDQLNAAAAGVRQAIADGKLAEGTDGRRQVTQAFREAQARLGAS